MPGSAALGIRNSSSPKSWSYGSPVLVDPVKKNRGGSLVRTGCLKWVIVVGLAVLGNAMSTGAEILWLRVGVAGMA